MPRLKLTPSLRRSKHCLTTLTPVEGITLVAMAEEADSSQSDVLRDALLASPKFKTTLRKVRARLAKEKAV